MKKINLNGYYGAKYYMTDDIIPLMPEHEIYLEPCLGGGSILLSHPRSPVEIGNDLDSNLANLYSVLADREKGKELQERLFRLPFDEEMFKEVKSVYKNCLNEYSEMDCAVFAYVMLSQSFNAVQKNFAKDRYPDDESYQRHFRATIPDVYERLEGVKIYSMDALDLLDYYADNPEVFVFLDPPYRQELRGKNAKNVYRYEMPDTLQRQMLRLLEDVKCKVLLCGYRSETGLDLYDEYLIPYGWKCYKLKDVPKLSQNKKIKDKGHEFVWCNYELPSGVNLQEMKVPSYMWDIR